MSKKKTVKKKYSIGKPSEVSSVELEFDWENRCYKAPFGDTFAIFLCRGCMPTRRPCLLHDVNTLKN